MSDEEVPLVNDIHLALFDCVPEDPNSELAFAKNDFLLVVDKSGEWWFAKNLRTKLEGWFDPSFVSATVLLDLNTSEPVEASERATTDSVFKQILADEKSIVSILEVFIDVFLKPLLLRDTPFKRSFLDIPAVAVTIPLVQEIYKECARFLYEFENAKTPLQVATAFANFSGSIPLFVQYAAENTNTLHAVQHTASKDLKQYLASNPLPDYLPLEFCFVIPLQHYGNYNTNFADYLRTFSYDDNEFLPLLSALNKVSTQVGLIDKRMKEEASNHMLLNLQNQFVGNSDIFIPTRRLLKEGPLNRIRTNGEARAYYGHLFNDCFMYSQRKVSKESSSYKLHKSLQVSDLVCVFLSFEECNQAFAFKITDTSTAVTVSSDGVEETDDYIFTAPSATLQREWVDAISGATKDIEAKLSKSGSNNDSIQLPEIDAGTLGPRTAKAYDFLVSENVYYQKMNNLYNVMILPLLNASKGQPLRCGSIQSKAAPPDKATLDAVTKALVSDADIQLFLRSSETIATSLKDMVISINSLCVASNWSESLCLGNILNSAAARQIHSQHKSYAGTVNVALRLFREPLFKAFFADCESVLVTGRGNLIDILEYPKDRVSFYLNFTKVLLDNTNRSHPDHKNLSDAFATLEMAAKEVNDVIALKKNFQKMLDIQSSFEVGIFSVNPVVQKLASTDRLFVKEGDLQKVNRKGDLDIYKFWLFSDVLIYGEAKGNSKFEFHRSIELKTCTVGIHESQKFKYAIEIFGAEKSFIVIAASQASQQDWLAKISESINFKKAKENIEEKAVAPIWLADDQSDECKICLQQFSLFRRRHHCRKCGCLVCADHSKNKVVLAYIHKSELHRVCDTCFANPDSTPTTSQRRFSVEREDSSSKAERRNSAGVDSEEVLSAPAEPRNEINEDLPPPPPRRGAPPPPPSAAGGGNSSDDSAARAPPPPPRPPPVHRGTLDITELIPPPPKPPVPPSSNDESTAMMPPPPLPPPMAKSRSNPPPPPVSNDSADSISATSQTDSPLRSRTNSNNPPPIVSVVEATKTESGDKEYPLPEGWVQKVDLGSGRTYYLQKSTKTKQWNHPGKPIEDASPHKSKKKGDADHPAAGATEPPKSARRPPSTPNDAIDPPAPGEKPGPPTGPPALDPDNPLYKYHKMSQMLPEGAVRQKMMTDGFSDAEIDAFMASKSGGGASAAPKPPASKAPPPPPGKAGAPPPPPPPPGKTAAPPPPPKPAGPSALDPDDPLYKYHKMKQMLPEGAVRQKMMTDGFSDAEIDAFFGGAATPAAPSGYVKPPPKPVAVAPATPAARPAAPMSIADALKAAPKLKSAESRELAPPPPKNSKDIMMDQIKMGSALKKVAQDDPRQKNRPASIGGGGLLNTLAVEMFKRRMHVENDSDSEASGFSDSDTDDDK